MRQSASSISSTLHPGDHREVAGHERQHARGEERDQPGDEGDRDVGSVDWVHRSCSTAAGAGSVERRGEAAAVLAGELVIGARARRRSRPSPRGSGRAGRGRSASAISSCKRLERGVVDRPRPRRRTRPPAAGPRSPSPLAARAAPGPPGPRRESLPGAAPAAPAPPLCHRGRAGSCPSAAAARHVPGSSSPAPCAATPRRRPRPARRRARGRGRRASARSAAGGIAPVNSATTWPSRNAFTAGIPWTPKLADERPGSTSTSTFASSTLPARLAIAASSAGPSWRHGRAPLGPEVDDDGQLPRAFDDLGHELGFG